MWQDIRFGLRIFRRSPGVTLMVLATLALGIGLNTTMFSVVNGVLLRPLPYQNPERIVQVEDLFPGSGTTISSSYPKFEFLRDHVQTLDSLAALSFGLTQIAGPAPAAPAELDAVRVTRSFFRVLVAAPAMGRTFTEDEERPGATPVAVISNTLWRNRFGSDPSAVGRTVTIDGRATSVIGVMPAGFDFPANTDVWMPRPFEHSMITPVQVQRGASFLLLFARLADGVNAEGARTEVTALSHQYDESHKGFGDTNRQMAIEPLRDSLVSEVRLTLMVLIGAAAFVLLIASANVANLLLARAVAREKEISIRASLGAGRRRLLVQLLTESVLLAGAGALLGIALSFSSMRAITQLSPDLLPRAEEVQIDASVLLFTTMVALLTGIVFGLGPALHLLRVDINESLKNSRSMSGGGRLRGAMVVAEVALAMVLLAGAGLLMRSFLRLEKVDPGFQPSGLAAMRISLSNGRYPQKNDQAAYYDRVLERAVAVPGVRSLAIANATPLSGRSIGYFFNIEGRPALEPSKAPTFWLQSISPAFFETLGVPLLRGRPFSASDTASSTPVGIISEAMAKRFWPNEDPIGRHVTYSREGITLEIVGVARDVKTGGLGDTSTQSVMYVPYRQKPFLTMWVLTRGPLGAAASARQEIARIDPDAPVTAARSMTQMVRNSLSTPRLRTTLISSFAALAVTLAILGIAGVVAWSVSRRTNEIGIRMALGAQPRNILALIVRQSFTLIWVGEIFGLAGALALTRYLSSFLFGVEPWDPVTFAGAALVLGAAGLLASFLVARRALRVDPIVALRAE